MKQLKCRKEKTEIQNIIDFCHAALLNDFFRIDYHEMLELTIIFLGECKIFLTWRHYLLKL